MANYKRSMTESIMQVYLGEDNMALMKKAAGGANQTIKMKDGKLQMDSFTASAIMAVYNAVNPKNKKSIEKMINSGSKSQIMKLQSLAMKQIKSSYEEVELDEDGHTDVASAQTNVKVAMSALTKMSGELTKLNAEDSLPSWWTNKVAVAVDKLDGMADYLDAKVEEVVVEAVSMAQQAAIAISKKERGNRPKKEESDIDEAVKVGDNIKVRLRRKGREYIEKGEVIKIDGDKITVKHDFSRTPSGVKMTDIVKEEVELDEGTPEYRKMMKNYAGSDDKKVFDILSKNGWRLGEQGDTLVRNMLKKHDGNIKKAADDIMKKYPKLKKEEVELDEKIEGLVTKAKKSGMPYGILKKVYDRGMAAYKTGHRPGTTSQQWAFARVNSFVTKSAGTWGKADSDLAKQVRGESVEEKDVEALSMVQLAAIAISEKERGENPKKKDEEVELDENFKKMSNDKLKAWLSKNDTEDSVSPVFGNQLKLAKRELISRGLKMKEEVDLDEGLVKKGIDLENAAKRSKNPVESDGSDKNDKKDMLKVAAMLKKGDRSGVVKFAKTLDDDRRLQTFGISLSPQEYVEDLLEEVDLDEARQLKNPKKEVMVVKKGKVEVIDKKDAKEYLNKGYSLAEASARADAMRAMRKGKTVDPADIDTDASDDDVKSASKNIIMQLRKSVSLRGNFPVEFTDKKKVKVSAKIAQAVQNKHNSMKKANDKEKFQAKVSKSYKDMLSALKENTILDKVSKKLKEIKNG